MRGGYSKRVSWSRADSWEVGFPFHSVGSGESDSGCLPGSGYLYPVSHLAAP